MKPARSTHMWGTEESKIRAVLPLETANAADVDNERHDMDGCAGCADRRQDNGQGRRRGHPALFIGVASSTAAECRTRAEGLMRRWRKHGKEDPSFVRDEGRNRA